MKLCDLHTHSIYSDGTYTPEEIINSAIYSGLSAVALCDHNTADGLPEFLAAAKKKDIEAISGVEFSVDYKGIELHLIGLYIPEIRFLEVDKLIYEINERKRESNVNLINALNKAGYEIDYEYIKNSTPCGNFNRAHIAAELTRKGYTESISAAFDTLLSKKTGYYKEPQRPGLFEMIDFIQSIGAISVLAHPFLNLSKDELEILLPLAKKRGLVGMECYYSLYDSETTKAAFELLEKFDLKPSGGSDFHGENKPDIMLGVGKGNLKIPYSYATALKNIY